MKERLVVLVGPTAVGKTKVSIELADAIGGEIISADSMQVYRGMDIGTAKISPEEMSAQSGSVIPHHMIDVVNPDADFSVADFQDMGRKLIKDINSRGKIPLVVGGTGLYIGALIDDYHFPEQETDWHFREQKKQEADKNGADFLHQQLMKIDPAAGQRLHPNDQRRIIRALEVYHLTGQTFSEWSKVKRQEANYDVVMIGLTMEREKLYQRINQRVDQMIADGLVDEVRNLIQQGYHPWLNSMQGLGYRQIAMYLTGTLTYDEAVYLLKRDTRRFAKRQYTWFKRDERIKWFDVTDQANIPSMLTEIIEYVGRSLGNNVE